VEPNFGDEPLATSKIAAFDSRVDISFHCVRKRLIDIDNISIKAVLDGIVASGLLLDDSAKYVRGYSVTQEKAAPGQEEKTTVKITEVIE